MNFLYFLLIGLLAGWLGGLITRGGGLGLVGNLVVGVIGAYIGGFVFRLMGLPTGYGFIGPLITATVGAATLLFLAGLIKK